MAIKKLWNDNWEFCEKPLADEYYKIPAADDFTSVDVPHDWMIYDSRNLYRDSIGWYHKSFILNKSDLYRRVSLRFDGVYMDSAVFVNGEQAGEWKYGYSAFEFDITGYITEGANDVWVRAVFQHCNSRWYPGAGIFRDVLIKLYNEEHIPADGIYISTVFLGDDAFRVEIETEVKIEPGSGKRKLRQSILGPDGSEVAVDSVEYGNGLSLKAEANVFSQTITVKKPLLWDIGQGNLYTLKTELLKDGKVIDTEKNCFGFKIAEFDAVKGFSLNGRHIKLNGVCEHHDFGCLGAAYHQDAMRRKFKILREMGVNSIRTAHNMPAKGLMELADEMGFLVVSEAFDTWDGGKATYDYGRFFNEWCERDVESWVRRDRNHVSLLMWSIGNEIYETMNELGVETTKRLVNAVRKHDPKKNAPTTIGSNYMKWENGQACSELVDVIGYNYGEALYDEHHEKRPDWIIYGSETSSMLASRGIYHFPLKKTILTDEDEQCSALGNSSTGWGALSYEDTIFDDRDARYSLGQFLWSGFDYIGEPTPYKTKNSYFGQIDTAGFPKDSYYIFRAEWTDYKVSPMVHLFPYWDWNPGQMIDVQVCTNAPECELFFNGKSLGRRSINHSTDRKTVQHFIVPYQTGKLYAAAYDENGKVIAEDTRENFSDTKSFHVKADRTSIKANGSDLMFLEIQAVDENGIPVDNARDRVNITVSGAGRLIGLDNGDSPDFDQYKGKSRRLMGGKLLAVIGAKTVAGDINVRLESAAAGTMEFSYSAIESDEGADGVKAQTENQDMVLVGGGSAMPDLPQGADEIPVRKIELRLEGESLLTTEEPSALIKAALYPANTTYPDVEWKVLNDSGIVIDYVDIEPTEDGAFVTARGDGDFRVRCVSYNGGGSVSVISEVMLEASGIGQAYINPYVSVLMGLCDVLRGSASEGIEQGIGFRGDGRGAAGFSHVDFGSYGTNEITVAIFANTDDASYFKLWEGDPDNGGELLLDATYHVKHEWMVFKEMTYTLAKRLTGKKEIYFTSESWLNSFKSFSFREEKAFCVIKAADCTKIYGDAYVYNATCVEGIGNNVLLYFDGMDFGDAGTDAVTICGFSPLEKSFIQLRFSKDGAVSTQMVEFGGCDEYTERTLPLEKVTGNCKVTLIFLPGSNFNLASFYFHKIICHSEPQAKNLQ